jgi:hypothetical protein
MRLSKTFFLVGIFLPVFGSLFAFPFVVLFRAISTPPTADHGERVFLFAVAAKAMFM